MKPAQAKSGKIGKLYYMKTVVIALCLGMISCAAMLSLFAALMSQVDLPGPIISVFAIVAICIGTIVFSFFTCRFVKKRPAVMGILCGAIVYLVIFIIGLFIPSSQMEPFNIAKFFAVFLSAVIGSVWSVSHLRKRHKA